MSGKYFVAGKLLVIAGIVQTAPDTAVVHKFSAAQAAVKLCHDASLLSSRLNYDKFYLL